MEGTDVNEIAKDLARKNQRRQRFINDKVENAKYVTPVVDIKKMRVMKHDGELDLEAMTIKGVCETVEKEYLRLTSAPHPSTVRPEPILRQALEMVKLKWKTGKCDYVYACSQLKSIRQDCTVQHIKNEFTVLVYETHARIALESGDINEFNQCQTQLHELYRKNIAGQTLEFMSYRILYCIYVSLQSKKPDSANAGQLGMYNVLAALTPELRSHAGVTHALMVREAVAMNNYHRFFQLHSDAPNMAAYLMDPMVPTIRLRALRVICKACGLLLPLFYLFFRMRVD
jgi:SAC3 family protein LENG8/THP3